MYTSVALETNIWFIFFFVSTERRKIRRKSSGSNSRLLIQMQLYSLPEAHLCSCQEEHFSLKSYSLLTFCQESKKKKSFPVRSALNWLAQACHRWILLDNRVMGVFTASRDRRGASPSSAIWIDHLLFLLRWHQHRGAHIFLSASTQAEPLQSLLPHKQYERGRGKMKEIKNWQPRALPTSLTSLWKSIRLHYLNLTYRAFESSDLRLDFSWLSCGWVWRTHKRALGRDQDTCTPATGTVNKAGSHHTWRGPNIPFADSIPFLYQNSSSHLK